MSIPETAAKRGFRWSAVAPVALLLLAASALQPAFSQEPEGGDLYGRERRVRDLKPMVRALPGHDPAPVGLPAAVQNAIDAHPDHDLVICMGGCGTGPGRIIWRRPRLLDNDSNSMPGVQEAKGGGTAIVQGDEEIVCIAGCRGPAGTVVWRGLRVAWLGETSREELTAALREVHQLLLARAEPAPIERRWMNAEARQHLTTALTVEAPAPQVLRTD
ncbi:MAG: hypothetical protein ACKVP7_01105 [Hyphomicrobiaceae bacterium]